MSLLKTRKGENDAGNLYSGAIHPSQTLNLIAYADSGSHVDSETDIIMPVSGGAVDNTVASGGGITKSGTYLTPAMAAKTAISGDGVVAIGATESFIFVFHGKVANTSIFSIEFGTIAPLTHIGIAGSVVSSQRQIHDGTDGVTIDTPSIAAATETQIALIGDLDNDIARLVVDGVQQGADIDISSIASILASPAFACIQVSFKQIALFKFSALPSDYLAELANMRSEAVADRFHIPYDWQ